MKSDNNKNIKSSILCNIEVHAQNKGKYEYPCAAISAYTKKKLYYLPHAGAKTSMETPIHFYATSDEKIKDGDWYRLHKNGKVLILKNVNQHKIDFLKFAMLDKEDIPFKKIIATTNKSLGIHLLSEKFVYKFMDKWEKNTISLKYAVAIITDKGLQIKHIKDEKIFNANDVLKFLSDYESEYISKLYVSGKAPEQLEWFYSKIV